MRQIQADQVEEEKGKNSMDADSVNDKDEDFEARNERLKGKLHQSSKNR